MTTPLREVIARFSVAADTQPLERADKGVTSLSAKAKQFAEAQKVYAQKFQAAKAAYLALPGAVAKDADKFAKQTLDAEQAAERAQASAKGIAEAFATIGKAVAGFAGVAALRSFVQGFVTEARDLTTTAERLRITTDELQVMGAVGRSVGLDINATAGALGTLRGKLDEAVRGLGDGGYTFRRLGVQFRDSNRQARPLVQVFGDVATALNNIQSPYRRMQITERLLGSEGRRFLQLFGNKADAIRDFTAAMEASGGGLSQASINAGLEYSQAINLAGLSVDTFRSKLALFLLPKLTEFIRVANRIAIYLNRTTIVTNGLRIALAALAAYGVRAAATWIAANLPLVAQFALIGASIAVVVLIVDDLITLFEGGESTIGGFIDELFGVGTAREVVNSVKDTFGELIYFVTITIDYIRELWNTFSLGGNSMSAARAAANQATRTPIRDPRRGNLPPGAVRAPDGSVVLAAPARRVVVPTIAPGASYRPAVGANPFARVAAPMRARPELNLNATTPVTVRVDATGATDPGAVGRATGAGVRRAIDESNAAQVRRLENSGLIHFAPEE